MSRLAFFAVRHSLLLFLIAGAGCRTDDEGIGGMGGSNGSGGRPPGSGGRGGTVGGDGGSGSSDAAPGTGGAPRDMGGDGDGPADAPSGSERAPEGMPDLRPDGPADLPVEVVPRSKPDGAVCQLGMECVSGVCAKGLCCNKACDDPCHSCARADTQMADGRCEISRTMVGMKCGRGCQQVVPSRPGVVDKTCDAEGRCLIPEIPQNFELCSDSDPCTSTICDQDSQKHTARCVTIGCAAGMCCCESGASRMCAATGSCTGVGKACAP